MQVFSRGRFLLKVVVLGGAGWGIVYIWISVANSEELMSFRSRWKRAINRNV